MYTCCGCRCKFSTFSRLLVHMRRNCKLYAGYNEFRCGEEGCFRHFSSSKALKNHLEKQHKPHYSPVNYTQSKQFWQESSGPVISTTSNTSPLQSNFESQMAIFCILYIVCQAFPETPFNWL